MSIQQKTYTASEFWQIVETGALEDDKRYELIEGIIIEMAPSSPQNAIIAMLIGAMLSSYVYENELGYVTGADGGYTISPGTVLIPDVAFIAKERAPKIPDRFEGAPDLAVEVISPSESARAVNSKTERYLNAGSTVVWNVYPEDKIVEVWRKGDGSTLVMQKYTEVDTITIDDVFADFSLPVSKIFPKG